MGEENNDEEQFMTDDIKESNEEDITRTQQEETLVKEEFKEQEDEPMSREEELKIRLKQIEEDLADDEPEEEDDNNVFRKMKKAYKKYKKDKQIENMQKKEVKKVLDAEMKEIEKENQIKLKNARIDSKRKRIEDKYKKKINWVSKTPKERLQHVGQKFKSFGEGMSKNFEGIDINRNLRMSTNLGAKMGYQEPPQEMRTVRVKKGKKTITKRVPVPRDVNQGVGRTSNYARSMFEQKLQQPPKKPFDPTMGFKNVMSQRQGQTQKQKIMNFVSKPKQKKGMGMKKIDMRKFL